jgi:hypothetical protein
MRSFGKQKQLSVCARKSKKEHRYIVYKNFYKNTFFKIKTYTATTLGQHG